MENQREKIVYDPEVQNIMVELVAIKYPFRYVFFRAQVREHSTNVKSMFQSRERHVRQLMMLRRTAVRSERSKQYL